MRWPLIIITTLSVTSIFAQTRKEATHVLQNLDGDKRNYDGSIVMNDGSEQKGIISYNVRTAILSFNSDAKTGTYSARNVRQFEFFDPELNIDRLFYSMEYEMPDGGQPANQFFEIIRQYKDFAVIGKTDPVVFKKKRTAFDVLIVDDVRRPNTIEVYYTTTFYFVSADLGIQAYLQFQVTDVERINDYIWDIFKDRKERTRKEILDLQAPKNLMGVHYKQVVAYARKNRLDWDEVDDLLAITDYYNSLVDN